MKYIISESQYRLISEQEPKLWLRRRLTRNNMEKFIIKGELAFPQLCDDFADMYDYAQRVIDYACDEFFRENTSDFNEFHDTYHKLWEIIYDQCVEWFSDYLFDIYIQTCNED